MSLREHLAEEAVKALRSLDAVEIGPTGSVEEAIASMQAHGSGCVVVTENGRPIGVVTERDVLTKVLARRLAPSTSIGEVMTREPETIDERDSVADVIRAMHAGGFRHMPVVDASGCLTGVISVKRVVEYLVDHFPAAVFNLPPDPSQRSFSREGA